MARAVATVPKRRGIPFVPTVALSFWRLRQTWRLLLISGLGVLAAVVLVCAVPLFSQVAMSAGLREALTNSQYGGATVTVQGQLDGGQTLTSADLRSAQAKIARLLHDRLGDYLSPGAPPATINVPFSIVPEGQQLDQKAPIQLTGADLTGDTSAYPLLEGRLPNVLTPTLELAVSKQLADDLHLSVGDTQTFIVQGPQPATISAHIVGILAARPQNQNGQEFYGGPVYYGPGGPNADYVALASNDTLLSLAGTLLSSFSQNYGPPIAVTWSFPLDLAKVTFARMGDLQDRLRDLATRGQAELAQSAGFNAYVYSNVLFALSDYQGRIILAQIPIVLMLLQVIGLVLLFISLMVNMLIERQMEAISILRSRGASRGLVLRTMTFQSVGVGLLALIGGPLLALLLVRAIGAVALSPADRSSLDVITGDPLGAAWDVRWYAFVAAICAVFAMIVSTRRAAGTNVLSLRRESARSNRKPFWVRLNLDLVFAGVSILGYAAYSYLIQHVPTFVKPFLSVLSLFAVIFLLLAVALLFLRFFPLLLRLFARIASGRRAASPMLAIGQMARSPRQASRMTLLLALSTAFALFALVFSASQAQRVRDVATYQTGADFRGQTVPRASGTAGARELETKYGAIAGVTSAAAVYTATSYGTSAAINFPIQILAVNPDTFGRTALWGSQESDQPLASLMAQLTSAGASATDAIPAVVDDAVWQAMRLTPGAEFSFSVAQNDMTATRFVAVAHVAHIPPVADGSGVQNGSGAGGVLVDLATFNAIYPKGQGDAPTATTHVATPNEVWLRTADDAAALASVRGAIASGALKLSAPSNASGDGPLDRRQAIQDSEADALHVDLLSVLAIAAGTALVLALVGILLGSWLNARNRLTSFALLRALGSEPRQLAGVLLWEQGIVYTLSLGLGVVIGAVLSAAVLPAIIFTTGTARTNVGSQQFIDAIDVPPIQTVVPWSQVGLVLGGLVAISLVSILLMTAQVARPSISQTLRLNED